MKRFQITGRLSVPVSFERDADDEQTALAGAEAELEQVLVGFIPAPVDLEASADEVPPTDAKPDLAQQIAAAVIEQLYEMTKQGGMFGCVVSEHPTEDRAPYQDWWSGELVPLTDGATDFGFSMVADDATKQTLHFTLSIKPRN
jgi:hypothetical protein